MSMENVRALLNAKYMHNIPIFPEFIQFLDDDVASLTALTLIVNPECRENSYHGSITQLTLSLYLTTQCQLKLGHSLTSLTQTLDYIEVTRRKLQVQLTLNHLTLKLMERKLVTYINRRQCCNQNPTRDDCLESL